MVRIRLTKKAVWAFFARRNWERKKNWHVVESAGTGWNDYRALLWCHCNSKKYRVTVYMENRYGTSGPERISLLDPRLPDYFRSIVATPYAAQGQPVTLKTSL